MFPDGSTTAQTDVNNFISVNKDAAEVNVDSSELVSAEGVISPALTPSYRALYFSIKLTTSKTDVASYS
jgi:hypothetical protein